MTRPHLVTPAALLRVPPSTASRVQATEYLASAPRLLSLGAKILMFSFKSDRLSVRKRRRGLRTLLHRFSTLPTLLCHTFGCSTIFHHAVYIPEQNAYLSLEFPARRMDRERPSLKPFHSTLNSCHFFLIWEEKEKALN